MQKSALGFMSVNPTPFAFRVNHLANRYTAPLARYLETEHGLLWPDWVALFCLAEDAGWSAKDLTEMTGRPKNTISRAVNKLLRLKLIERHTHADDARVQVLKLTAAGRRLYKLVLPKLRKTEASIYAGLTNSESEQFSRLLDKLIAQLIETPE